MKAETTPRTAPATIISVPFASRKEAEEPTLPPLAPSTVGTLEGAAVDTVTTTSIPDSMAAMVAASSSVPTAETPTSAAAVVIAALNAAPLPLPSSVKAAVSSFASCAVTAAPLRVVSAILYFKV